MAQPFTQDSLYVRGDVEAALGKHKAEGPFLVGGGGIEEELDIGSRAGRCEETPGQDEQRGRHASLIIVERTQVSPSRERSPSRRYSRRT